MLVKGTPGNCLIMTEVFTLTAIKASIMIKQLPWQPFCLSGSIYWWLRLWYFQCISNWDTAVQRHLYVRSQILLTQDVLLWSNITQYWAQNDRENAKNFVIKMNSQNTPHTSPLRVSKVSLMYWECTLLGKSVYLAFMELRISSKYWDKILLPVS